MLSLASTEEKAMAAATFVSYCGRYEIKGEKVIHHVEASLDPNVTGEPVERHMQLAGERLSLTMPPFPLLANRTPVTWCGSAFEGEHGRLHR